jgi:RHS repeat-associated protein
MVYTYDNDSRLIGTAYNFGATSLGNLSYAYDPLGHLIQRGGSLARTGLPQPVISAAYDAANELTNWNGIALSYDSNGNMLSDGTNTFAWDARNHLAMINGSNLLYDAFGRRIQNLSGTSFLYDGVNAVQELSGSTVTASLLTGGVDEVFSRSDASGSFGFLRDNLGSTLALADVNGNLTTSYTYDPFGVTTVTGQSSTSAYQYTGRENEGNGLYFYRARYYNPGLQRFISEDPIGLLGGLNPYAYVDDDPIRYIDPQGKDPVIGVTVGAIAGGIYGGIGAALQGGGFGDIAGGVIAGALVGGGIGALDPSLGVGTLAIIGGLGGGVGDILGQLIAGAGGPCKPINWGSTIGAVLGGAVSGAGGSALGQLGAAAGLPEVPATIGATTITAPPGVFLPATGAALWSPPGGEGAGNGKCPCH